MAKSLEHSSCFGGTGVHRTVAQSIRRHLCKAAWVGLLGRPSLRDSCFHIGAQRLPLPGDLGTRPCHSPRNCTIPCGSPTPYPRLLK